VILLSLAVGTTSKRIPVFIRDSNSPNGGGLTGLVFNSAGLTWTVYREDDGNAGGTAVTLATATLGTWATGGFVEKDSTNLPGWYELGVPNAALVSGSAWLRMQLANAAGMVVTDFVVELVVSGSSYSNSIALGVLAHVGPTSTANEVASVALGALAHTGPAAVLAAPGAVELDVDAGSSLVAGQMDNQFIALHVDVAVTPSIQVGAGDAIALGVDAHTGIVEQETYGATRRGKSAVVVTAKSTGKSTVR